MRIRQAQGFTLFEILVVLVVIALAGSALVFGFGQTLARQKDASAEQVFAWLQAVADTSVFQSTVIGVAESNQQLILLGFYQDDWYRLEAELPYDLDGELRLQWSDELVRNADSYELDEDRLAPYMVFTPTGDILPEGEIAFFDGENLRAEINWETGYELNLAWKEIPDDR